MTLLNPFLMHDFGFEKKPENPKPGDMWIESNEEDEPRIMICVDKKYLEEMMEIWKTDPRKDKS